MQPFEVVVTGIEVEEAGIVVVEAGGVVSPLREGLDEVVAPIGQVNEPVGSPLHALHFGEL